MAVETLTITVVPGDIARGIRGMAQRCPVAWALSRQYPDVRCTVMGNLLTVNGHVWWCDPVLTRLIADYDDGLCAFSPGTYTATRKTGG